MCSPACPTTFASSLRCDEELSCLAVPRSPLLAAMTVTQPRSPGAGKVRTETETLSGGGGWRLSLQSRVAYQTNAWEDRRWNPSTGESAGSELMQELVNKLNGAYVSLAATLLQRTPGWLNPAVQKQPIADRPRDQKSLLRDGVKWFCLMVPTSRNWPLWKSDEQRILSRVFEWCASDRVLSESEEGELGVTHLFFVSPPVWFAV